MLIHPTFVGLVTAGESITLFGLPVGLVSYSSSLLPAILAIWIMSYVEKFIKKYTPAALAFLLVPSLILIVMMVVVFVGVGPLGYYIGVYLADEIMKLNDVFGGLTVVVIAVFKPLIVMTGMHYALMTAFIQMFVANGFDTFYLSSSILSNLGQAGATFGVMLKTKDKKIKAIAGSTALTALIAGVTEPAMFGITLKYKKPFIAAMIGAGLGGIYAGFIGIKIISMTGVGILGLLGVASEFLIHMVIAAIITLVSSCIISYILGIDESSQEESKIEEVKKEITVNTSKATKIIGSPMEGKTIALSEVKDITFAKEIIGKGVAIIPREGKIFAPVDGEIVSFFPTKHAIGIVNEDGVELLIHVGMDTAKLEGKYFHAHAKQGDKIKKGDLLLTFDIKDIQDAGYDIVTPIVITNKNAYMDIFPITLNGKINCNDDLLAIID